MKAIWDRLDSWLAENAPLMFEALNPGATLQEIAEVERIMGISLPDDVRETYLAHNGCKDYGFFDELAFLSLEEAMEARSKYMASTIWEEPEEPEEWPLSVDLGIRVTFFHRHWFPFAHHDHYCDCIDLAPARGGDIGQVIQVEVFQPMRSKVCNSLRMYLERFLEEVEAGEYAFSKELECLAQL